VATSIFVISLPVMLRCSNSRRRFSVHKLSPNTKEKPVYAGSIVVPEWDIDIPGKFQPLVTQAVFDKVQLILDRRAAALTPRVRCHEKSRQLGQKQRLQQVSFLKNVNYSDRRFRTSATSLLFSGIQPNEVQIQVTEEPSEQVGGGAPPSTNKTHPYVRQKDKAAGR
jgi:hypothetical protein